MLYEIYTWQKMRELEREGRALVPGRVALRARGRRAGGLVRLAGRLLRRLGTELEGWGEERPDECCEARS